MDCIIPGANIKVLGKALQALCKIGDELYLESKKDSLSLITLNMGKTVCARYRFLESFFSSYEVAALALTEENNETLTCKIHMKIFLPLFKGHLEKKIDFFKWEFENDAEFMIFKMKYKCDDILMVHKLRLMENETLTIGVSPDTGSNILGGSSSFFNQLLSMFNVSDDEITLEITDGKVVARNYCLGTPCRPKMMRSQINLAYSEFISYQITNPTTINFSLKPFRTVISFAENFNLNIEFNFETGGKPLSLILHHPTFEFNMMIATINPNSDGNSSVVIPNAIIYKPTCKTPPEKGPLGLAKEVFSRKSSKDSFVELIKKRQEKAKAEDLISNSPESPRTKRARFVFGRCHDNTFQTVIGEVLAENSDSE